MKLFEIANNYQEVIDKNFNPVTGEVYNKSLNDIDLINYDFKKECIAIESYIRNINTEKESIAEQKKILSKREEELNKNFSSLEYYFKSNMEKREINEISCAYFQAKIKKCPPSVDVIDKNIIPIKYKRTKEVTSIDKLKIKEDITHGVVIPGASLKQNNRLEIR